MFPNRSPREASAVTPRCVLHTVVHSLYACDASWRITEQVARQQGRLGKPWTPASRVIAIVMGSAFATGCAVVDPLRRPYVDPPPGIIHSALTHPAAAKCEFGGCIEQAVAYGEAWRQHYYD